MKRFLLSFLVVAITAAVAGSLLAVGWRSLYPRDGRVPLHTRVACVKPTAFPATWYGRCS